ncbi:hypothetical protein EYR36_000041 [Pleurotus pulmonarius]|nr:hypothetical protein EYR36_000041 [Pleurotus pulmonarius]
MSFTIMARPTSRAALVDSTNSPSVKSKNRGSTRAKQAGFPLASSSRKAAPTCTVSLAFASASSGSSLSAVSTDDTFDSNLIPFPSSAISFPSSQPFSESDAEMSYPDFDSVTSCAQSPQVGWRRRRSNACLTQTLRSRSSSPSPKSKSSSSSIRKRSRNIAKRLNADLQFLTLLQRSVAWRLARHGLGDDAVEVTPGFEVQDMALVARLRSYLIAQGCGPGDVATAFDMDIDLTVNLHSPSPVHSGQTHVAPMSTLVASLILRHRERSALRARSTTPFNASTRSSVSRAVSPLALCAGQC